MKHKLDSIKIKKFHKYHEADQTAELKFTWSNKQQAVIKLVHKGELWYSFVSTIMIVKTVEQLIFFVIPYPEEMQTNIETKCRFDYPDS